MQLSPQRFDAVCQAFAEVSGIRLVPAKKSLVEGRLQKLAMERGIESLDDYVDEVLSRRDSPEFVRLVDKLTTNETYFFRESEHFDVLTEFLDQSAPGQRLRVWSAASSSGEEAYSIAMLMHDRLGDGPWEVVGTDLSTDVVRRAQRGLYPMERARNLPNAFLKRYCLRGTGDYQGQLLIDRSLRQRVRFTTANLMEPLPEIGRFDIIFLRNVLIYFENDAKRSIVQRVLRLLNPGGLLFTGHAESLNNLGLPIKARQPAVYEAQ
jgi:chemotaxis protein methyltransferase CheR